MSYQDLRYVQPQGRVSVTKATHEDIEDGGCILTMSALVTDRDRDPEQDQRVRTRPESKNLESNVQGLSRGSGIYI